MLAILNKELRSYFASPIAYLVIGLFLVLSGLFLWVFKGAYNVFDNGFSDLSSFFLLAPWLFLFIIPAIGMKSFAEERKLGTLELLFIKPTSTLAIVMGKFLGIFLLLLFALTPTLLYVYSIGELGITTANYDLGIVIGSYFGLLFLVASYCAISIFCSSITENQVVAFILAVVICLFFYYGFQGISTLFPNQNVLWIVNLGMQAHFNNVAKGIIDTKDLIYFCSISFFFIYITVQHLKNLHK